MKQVVTGKGSTDPPRRLLTEDERRIIATDEACARATGNPRAWVVIVDRQGNQSIATTFR